MEEDVDKMEVTEEEERWRWWWRSVGGNVGRGVCWRKRGDEIRNQKRGYKYKKKV